MITRVVLLCCIAINLNYFNIQNVIAYNSSDVSVEDERLYKSLSNTDDHLDDKQTGFDTDKISSFLQRESRFNKRRNITPLKSSSTCPSLRNLLPNGWVKLRSNGRIARFACYDGFDLIGNRYATCIRGRWNRDLPVCVSSGCSNITSQTPLKVKSMNQGTVLDLSCDLGYYLVMNISNYASYANVNAIANGETNEPTAVSNSASMQQVVHPFQTLRVYCVSKDWRINDPSLKTVPGTVLPFVSLRSVPTCKVYESPVNESMKCDFERSLCGWFQDFEDDFDWLLNRHTTPSHLDGTGPSVDHTLGKNGTSGYYLYIESSYPRYVSEKARIFSPIYQYLNGIRDACFQFYYHMYGKAIGSLRVYVLEMSQVLKELTPRLELIGDQGDQWLQAQIELNAPSNATQLKPFQIVIEGEIGHGHQGDIAIDDLLLTLGTNCSNYNTSLELDPEVVSELNSLESSNSSTLNSSQAEGMFAINTTTTTTTTTTTSVPIIIANTTNDLVDKNLIKLDNISSSVRIKPAIATNLNNNKNVGQASEQRPQQNVITKWMTPASKFTSISTTSTSTPIKKNLPFDQQGGTERSKIPLSWFNDRPIKSTPRPTATTSVWPPIYTTIGTKKDQVLPDMLNKTLEQPKNRFNILRNSDTTTTTTISSIVNVTQTINATQDVASFLSETTNISPIKAISSLDNSQQVISGELTATTTTPNSSGYTHTYLMVISLVACFLGLALLLIYVGYQRRWVRPNERSANLNFVASFARRCTAPLFWSASTVDDADDGELLMVMDNNGNSNKTHRGKNRFSSSSSSSPPTSASPGNKSSSSTMHNELFAYENHLANDDDGVYLYQERY